jgi:hypothetical protein
MNNLGKNESAFSAIHVIQYSESSSRISEKGQDGGPTTLCGGSGVSLHSDSLGLLRAPYLRGVQFSLSDHSPPIFPDGRRGGLPTSDLLQHLDSDHPVGEWRRGSRPATEELPCPAGGPLVDASHHLRSIQDHQRW